MKDISTNSHKRSHLWSMGHAADDRGDFKESARLFEETLVYARREGDKRTIADALYNLGLAYSNLVDNQGARRCFLEALDLYRETGRKNEEADCLWNLAEATSCLGDPAEACRLLKDAAALYSKYSDNDHRADCLISLGDTAIVAGQYDLARDAYAQAADLYRKDDNLPDEAEAISLEGSVLERMHMFDKAEECYRSALEKISHLAPSATHAECYSGLGRIVASVRQSYAEARELFSKGQRIYRDEGDIRRDIMCECDMALVIIYSGSPEEGLDRLNRAVARAEKTDDPFILTNCLFDRADACDHLDRPEDAKADLLRFLSIIKAEGLTPEWEALAPDFEKHGIKIPYKKH
jgi:tetratricopeptide (TPR) repeat protein